MGIFKEIAIRYCEKIYNAYIELAEDGTYKGKEAELLIERNEYARCLIETLKKKELKDDDYVNYFQQLLGEINLAFEQVNSSVSEYNSKRNTQFTTHYYETFYTSSLKIFINSLNNLYQKSPEMIKNIQDISSFKNDRNVPWINQFSFVLYDYMLEKEFELATKKISRDIFDTKIQLILKFIQSAANLTSRYEQENDAEYRELMKMLLQKMRTEENEIQQRKPKQNKTYYSYLTQSFYKAAESLIRSNLGEKIDFLINEFCERSANKTLEYCH